MDGYYKGRRVLEYRTMGDFAKGQNFVQHLLPHAWAGTGHVVYNGSLYYNKHQSNILVGAGAWWKRGTNKRTGDKGVTCLSRCSIISALTVCYSSGAWAEPGTTTHFPTAGEAPLTSTSWLMRWASGLCTPPFQMPETLWYRLSAHRW